MNRIKWAGCFVCWWLCVRVIPIHWRLFTALLPHAGTYAYLTYDQACERVFGAS